MPAHFRVTVLESHPSWSYTTFLDRRQRLNQGLLSNAQQYYYNSGWLVVFPGVMMTARSMTFLNSRMLPGQG